MAVRADQDAVVGVLDAGSRRGMVGPTSAEGWTALWVPYDRRDLPRVPGDFLSVEEDVDGVRVQVRGEGRTRACTVAAEPTDGPDARAEVALAICHLFGAPGRLDDVLGCLEAGGDDEVQLVDALAGVVTLPPTWEGGAERAVVVHRGDRRSVRLAASLTGPTRLTALADGWSVLADAEDPSQYVPLALGTAAAGPRRRNLTLALWRGAEGASGIGVPGGRSDAGGHAWNTGWRETGPADLLDKDEWATSLVRRLGADAASTPAVRALLRATSRSGDPLADIVALLGIPAAAVAVLDGRDDVPPHELVARVPWWRGVWIAMSGGDPAPSTPRWLRVLGAGATAVAALVSVLMTVLTLVVVATDGAAVDAPASSAWDWLWLVGFALLSVVLSAAAVAGFRSARR